MRNAMLLVVLGLLNFLPGCVMSYPGNVKAAPLREVAADGGWKLQVARLPGVEGGGKLQFTDQANEVLVVNGPRGGMMFWWDFWREAMGSMGGSTQPSPAPVWFKAVDNTLRLYDVTTGRQTGTAATLPAAPNEPPASAAATAAIQNITRSYTNMHPSPDGKWVLWVAVAPYSAKDADQSPMSVFTHNGLHRAYVIHDATTGKLMAVVGTNDYSNDFRWLPDSSGFQTLRPKSWDVTRFLLPSNFGLAPATQPAILFRDTSDWTN